MTKSMNSLTPRRKTPCLPFRKSRRLLSALRLNARQVFQRLADERLAQWAERYPSASLCLVFDPAKASLTDAVNEAATPLVAPPRPATSVLGGFATSSAPAFPCSCSAADAAAAAMHGDANSNSVATIGGKTYHLHVFVM